MTTVETTARTLAERYVAVWNETDATARRALIADLWAEGGTLVDPLSDAHGHDAIDAVIAGVQQHFPGFVVRLLGEPEGHHALVRFAWEMGPVGGPAPVAGSDVAVLDGDGRVTAVLGFLDRVPAA